MRSRIIISQSKFKAGDLVYAKENPSSLLVVKSFMNKVYFCFAEEDPSKKQLVFLEGELLKPALS
jgi:hypothetical protein